MNRKAKIFWRLALLGLKFITGWNYLQSIFSQFLSISQSHNFENIWVAGFGSLLNVCAEKP